MVPHLARGLGKRKHVRAVGMYLGWGRQAMLGAEWGRGRTIPREPNSHISLDWRLPSLPKKAAGLARPSVSDFNGSAGPASAKCPRAFPGRLGP